MCIPSLSAGGGPGLNLQQISKKGDLTGSQFLEGDGWEEGVDFFQGTGSSFYIKNKLKSEIFNDQKKL